MRPQPFLLAAALSDPNPRPDPGRWRDAARAAEDAGLDLVTIEPGPADPLLVAARLAAQTERIGIAPVVSTTTSEPFHVSTALATIDVVGGGRGGWVVRVDRPEDVRGTVTWEVPDDVAGDAAEHVEAVRALWDSWEADAVIRDTTTDRFLDRSRVHHVEFRGEHLAVRGPSITPRPPQGHPVVLVRAADEATLALAGRVGDLVLTAEPGAGGGSGEVLPPGRGGPGAAPDDDGPRRLVEVAATGPGEVDGLVRRLVALHAAGAAGALLHAADLAGVLDALVPALRRAGLRDPADDAPPPTLRERLGLPAAVNRFAVAR